MSTPNPAAVALGKRRWAGTTKADRSEAMRALANQRTEALTPARRVAIAKKASLAAAKKRRAAKKKKNSSH